MIPSRLARNSTKPFPVVEGLKLNHSLTRLPIKTVYQRWTGESIKTIQEKATTDNPYSLRIGLPHVDEKLKSDNYYFILNYLSYNPVTKCVENREIVPYRNTETIYIGQSLAEIEHKDYKLFVDGKAVMQDLEFIGSQKSLKKQIQDLQNTVEMLQKELIQLRKEYIYK